MCNWIVFNQAWYISQPLSCQSALLISFDIGCFLCYWEILLTLPIEDKLTIYENLWQKVLQSSMNLLKGKQTRFLFLVIRSLISKLLTIYKTLLTSFTLRHYSRGKLKLTFISKKLSLLYPASRAFCFSVSNKALPQTNNIEAFNGPVTSRAVFTTSHHRNFN